MRIFRPGHAVTVEAPQTDAPNPKQGRKTVKNTITRTPSGETGACNWNPKKTVAGGLRVRTGVKAGIVVTKVTDSGSTN
jgi:hypothetical protein